MPRERHPSLLRAVECARRYAPAEVTAAELAVALELPLRTVRRLSKGVTPLVPSAMRDARRTIGLLAERLHEATGETWDDIAESSGCSRQHLVKCREEAGE